MGRYLAHHKAGHLIMSGQSAHATLGQGLAQGAHVSQKIQSTSSLGGRDENTEMHSCSQPSCFGNESFAENKAKEGESGTGDGAGDTTIPEARTTSCVSQ